MMTTALSYQNIYIFASFHLSFIFGLAADLVAANDCVTKCDTECQINCVKGLYYSFGNCIECPAGFYCPGGTASPRTCQPGTVNKSTGKSNITDCQPCPDGYISTVASIRCKPCPAGFSCDPKDGTYVACGPGHYSPEGALSCLPCMKAYICPNGNTTLKCPPGMEPNSDHTSCVNCWRGYFSRESDFKCSQCPAGYLCPVVGLTSPILCSAGTYQPKPGQTRCLTCPAGRDCTDPSRAVPCPAGTYNIKGGTRCLPCASGFYNDKPGAFNCIKCPSGSFCSPTEAVRCEPGYYSESGMTSCLPCPGGFNCEKHHHPKPCGLGKYALNGTKSCEDCPRGHYCPYEANIQPIPCAPGYYANNHGQAECKKCNRGEYCKNPASDPVLCPVGKHCVTSGLTAPQACPFGTYADTEGNEQCALCPAGYSCIDPSLSPELCKRGSYSPVGEIYCQPCPSGTYSNQTGGTICSICPAGFFCSDPALDPRICTRGSFSSLGSIFCTSCPLGTYSKDSFTERCVFCPAGYACPDPKDDPVPCKPGQYSLGNATSCIPCPAGYKCSSTASVPEICPFGTFSTVGLHTCQLCDRGFYCPQKGSTGQIRCAPGFFSMMGSKSCKECLAGCKCPDPSEHPVPCQEGFFSLPGSQNCTACPEGFRCTVKSLPPQLCHKGTFSAANSRNCTPCPKGFYCPRDGLSKPIICPPGWYQEKPSQSECIQCPPGSQCPERTLPPEPCEPGLYSKESGSEACTPCPAGHYTISFGSVSCTKCAKGFRCPINNQLPISCNPGQYSMEGSSQCFPCPLGAACSDPAMNPFQCQVGSTTNGTNCLPCPSGFQCPSPLTGPQACPPGSYQELYGKANCKVCPPGFSCLKRSSSPELCAEGFYSPAGEDTCLGCPSGLYSDVGWETCQVCPPGQECREGKQPTSCPAGTYSFQGSCQPCASGTYSDIGWSECSKCPSRHLCPDPAKQPIPFPSVASNLDEKVEQKFQSCPAGMECSTSNDSPIICSLGSYSLEGQRICLKCPPGYACKYRHQSPASCSLGQTTFGKEGMTECSPCPAGFACESPQILPKKCPIGTYSLEGSTLCSLCPPGSACPYTSSIPVPCIVGSYSTSGQQNCTMCQPGYACSNTTKAEDVQCFPGSYSVGSQSHCTVCPAGYYCPDTKLDIKIACLPGHYAYTGFATCRACPAGWQCPQKDGSQNTQCPKGTFSTGLQKACTLCPAGKACPTTNTNNTIPCQPGSYSVGQQAECTVCPPGYECPSITESIVKPCSMGFYSSGGAVTCTQCQPGYACPSRFEALQIACLPGTFANAGFTQCVQCPAGQQCAFTNMTSENCLPGYYSLGGEVSCKLCPAGFYCPRANQPPEPCPAGSYSHHGSSSCFSCALGYICPEASSSSTPGNQQCPLGYYCDDGITPKQCRSGTYGAHRGLKQASECSTCPAGFYCPGGTAGYPSTDLLCPSGYYCKEGTSQAHSNPCPHGTSSDEAGLKSQQGCKQCSEGRICAEGTADGGRLCSKGKYCPAGTTKELDCPRGTVTQHQGASGIHMCTMCPVGHYCPSGSSNPTPCQRGTYNPNPGQADVTDCLPCIAGYACTQLALKRPDAECMDGFVCPAGSSNPQDPKNACPPGTFSNFPKLSDKAYCEICPPRRACLKGTGRSYRRPLPCSPGHYCPAGTEYPTQYRCPAGSWSNQTNLTSSDECFPCPGGMYCMTGATSPTGTCKSGFYCPIGTQLNFQFPCPPGTYSTRLGNSRIEDCLQCPEGSYCLQATSKPIGCPKGTYRNEEGGSMILDCTLCPAGYFCSELGTIIPRSCGTGRYSDFGSASCDLCLLGHYCNSERTSWEVMSTQLFCPAGLVCPVGLSRVPDFNKDGCPKGYYCLQGNIDPNPRACPNGTYSDRKGLVDESQCVPCPAGKYCYSEGTKPVAISQPTGDCPGGHYCPLGTGNPHTFPCKPGFYLSHSAAEREESCSQCPPGYYCESFGLENPKVCPKGFYCILGSKQPQPCQRGTYSDKMSLRALSDCIPCGGGQYCAGESLTQPTGNCKAGFYCRERAVTATPIDGITGDICSAGGYCPVGSAFPVPCPMGTFSNGTGLTSSEECLACPPGFFCSILNAQAPSGPCNPGYFCTGGASTPTQHGTAEGHYSLAGTARPMPCPLGTFQMAPLQSSCSTCLRGRYCNQTGLVSPPFCIQGHYCPTGSILPIPCPVGYYLHQKGAEDITSCKLCDLGMYCSVVGLAAPEGPCQPGYYCTSGSNTSVPVELSFGDVCPAGYYCPLGTKHAFEKPCPTGTWNNITGAQDITFCLPCPPGYACHRMALTQPSRLCAPGFYCKERTTTTKPLDGETGDLCPEGHYCPEGTAMPLQCGDGSYNNVTGQSKCFDCPAGFYCVEGYIIRPCPEGHYCTKNTGWNHLPCPPGTYNPAMGQSKVEQCLQCPAGTFCGTWGLAAPSGPCQQGYYCLTGVDVENPNGNINTGVGEPCPMGHYCPVGTSVPLSCPMGTYSDKLYLSMVSNCTVCSPGMYCGSTGLIKPSGSCDPGFFCLAAATTPRPLGAGDTGGLCPVGHYCSAGTIQPIPCPAGTYNNASGQARCFSCPPGYFCPQNTTTYSDFPCPAGFYCPNGTKHSTEFPCPRGYYNPEPMTQSLDSCLPCPPGHYCEKEKLTSVSGKCKAGWFCVSAAWTSQPFDLDNYTTANCLCPATATGGKCQPGFYCPEGSIEPTPCPPGTYCNDSGLAEPSGECSPGYYCIRGATKPQNTDGITGNLCPGGSYCGAGSGEPTPCPSGTYSNIQALSDVSECLLCTAGFYCDLPGLTAPTNPCSEGFFCPPGQNVSKAVACPPGHYCPEGSAKPKLCDSGSWQDLGGRAECKPCVAGYYCDNRIGPVVDIELYPCPAGFYCPVGTQAATQYGCPPGTFSPNTRLKNINECQLCLPGQYCASFGLSAPSGDCLMGFWCRNGADIDSPVDGKTGEPCPAGNYCPAGTTVPIPCPVGTWANNTGSKTPTECEQCPGGWYCNGIGLRSPSGLCASGYFCTGGTSCPRPTDGVTGGPCKAGHFCPEGTTDSIPCKPGTYMTATHANDCLVCPGGRYCTTGLEPSWCPSGFYCPEGTSYDWQPCPPGTYSPVDGLARLSECRPCDGGKYCAFHNAVEVTGECWEGYYCVEGSDSPAPELNHSGKAGPCPVGHYCPYGTSSPKPCPLGTFSNQSKLVLQSDCMPCIFGHYCGSEGLEAPSGECWEGFYCLRGAKMPNNPVQDDSGGPCPQGYFCPSGTAFPEGCPTGTYSALEGQGSCSPCMEGYFCPSNTSSYESNICVPGHYCPPGTESKDQFPCPTGTYNRLSGRTSVLDCTLCDAGHYCERAGQENVTGLCAAGYYCMRRATTPTPTDGISGNVCPPGHFCVTGASSPQPCPAGYYSNSSQNTKVDDCLPCPPGLSCDRQGLVSASRACDAGFYCPPGQNSSRPAPFICTKGSHCPQGSVKPTPCSSGTYQDQTGQASCIPCPAGFFCDLTSNSDSDLLHGIQAPLPCPRGYYCPEGTKSASRFPCPLGTFSNQTGIGTIDDCLLCPPGKYCDRTGLTEPTGDCWEGYYCNLKSSSPKPSDEVTGWRCPRGSYCPRGTKNIQFCPVGYYGPVQGRGSESDCLPCPPGLFCNISGLAFPAGKCSAGYYCSGKARTATPTDHITGNGCPVGHFCPPSSAQPLPCPAGQYTDVTQSFTCQTCPSGYYCPPKSSTLKICPMGFYCPVGSSDVLKPCPRGTFGDLMGLVNSSDCKPCSPGYYCDKQNATSVTGLCASGYYCRSGSESKEPVGDHRGDAGPCPPGYYCPLGTANPIGCPIGTFSNLPQLRPLDECQLCSQGYYCDRMALTIPSGLCQAGFYCVMGSNTSRPTQVTPTGGPCPPGYYCTEGSSRPQPCPTGTYNPFWEQKQCLFCPQGHYCEAEDINSTLCPSELNSVKTHRYPSGRATPKPCPSGEYQDQIGQIQCKPCPLGKHCDPLQENGQHNESKAGTIQPIDCPAGYYCIKGMLYPCPEGTYSNQTGRYSIEQCKPCPGGKYCALKGMSGYTGLCDPGCVCVLGASYPCPADNITGYKCPPGSYCPQGASHGIKCPAGTFGPQDSLYSIFECITCTPGFYCNTEGLDTPTGPCSPGYFCLYGATLPNPVGDLYGDKCPPGHFCPSGSISPRPCPRGTYQPLHGMTSKNACLPCTGGKYCDVQGLRKVSGDCTAGFYCISGASRPSPINGITGGRCPLGHYCPTASSQPLKCKSGYYCPRGTMHTAQYPCPVGTYNNRTMAQSVLDCISCPAGQYCDRKGLSTPSGICPPGFYCPGAVCKSQPEIQTNTSDHHGIQNFTGNICPPGFYCPEGSSQPVPCDLGQYCGQPGLSSPTGPCVAGFLCDGKASVMNPKPCPAGYYCPEGTTYSKPCPPGTLSGPGGVAVTDCSPCPSGHYCETYSLSAPSGLCSAGYYCPRGQSVPEPLDYICSPGHFCPEGSSNQTNCAPGHYQPKWGKERCEICPPGYYCQTSGVFKPVLCPLGSFCPPKSTSQHFCPEGTYGNRTGLHEALGCLPCDPGMYCQGSGNTKPTGPCSAGYMCMLGAALPTPTDGITGDKCLPGFFCTNGSVTGQPCPKGTFSDKRGLSAARHCQNCSPGHFCAETGLIAVSGPCWAGFYCLEGSKTPTPIASVFGDICPPGHFCPNATTHLVPCPPGTLRATTGGRSEEDCMLCPSGFYCKKPGKDSVEGFCDPGFYCLNGAKTATPRDGATGDLCPVGYYCPLASPGLKLCQNGTSMNHTGAEKCNICPEGSLCTKTERVEPCPQDSHCPKGSGTFPQPCPVGTFGASRGLRKKSDCIPCLGGFYCSRPGLSEVEGPCDPGFYCESGVNSPRPSQYLDHTGNGSECSVGAYCPRNSTVPIPCPPGTYNSEIGQSDCKICLAGYFCLGGTSNPFPLKCPTGHFCPERTQFGEEYHCPPGTYNSLPGQQSPADCLICPPGQFCEGTGLSTTSGNCSKGWYCTGGSVTSKPLPQGEFSNISEWASQKIVSPGNRCPPGFFCPEGSSLPLICTAGFYCDQYELAEPTGPCDAGYYCPIGSTERTPDTFRCIVGHYCPEGSLSPKPCPEGTYSNTPMNKVPEDCLPCTPGFFCEGIGLFHPTGLCVSGYYCPGGQSAPTPANLSCPPGSRCPAGSSSPDPCPGGFYQALQGQFECNPCPAGSYCYTSELDKWGVKAPQRCPPGHFCPPRTEFGTQYKCPPGTFSNKEGQISAAECDLCPPGQFCGQEGLIEPSGSCLTGFYCFRGAMYPNPTDGITGDICPMGKFCEAGSIAGVDCPIGHYSNKTGLTSPSDCTPCDPGFHCSSPGLTAPQGPCARGYYCRLGAQSPNPDNGIEGAICPAGYYCVSGTERPVPCPVGTYNPSEGRDSVAGCLPCDPGHYCGNIGLIQPSGLCFEGYYCIGHTSQPTPQDGENGGVCPEGFYCQAGTHKPVPCPIGTFLNHSGGTECVVCPAGFYCIYGKKINPCPLGFYCPEGTGADIAPCPAGTYGGRMGLKEENDCFPCKGGFYCARDGLSSPQGKCDPGHYCISGVNIPNPGPTQIFLGKGGKCGAGQQCPSGSVLPQTCPPGTYTEEEGLEHCKTCPAGYYCPPTSMIPKLCPPGYYCPTATEEGTQYPCPPGTFNGQSGSRSERECLVCPAGQYCSGSGLSEPSGLCAAGYYCTGGSTTNKPTSSHLTSNISLNSTSEYEWCFKQHYVMGGLCPAGYYCPTGSSTPLPCDGGKYCSNPGLSIPTDGCFAGYYCDAASTQPDQHICPAGFYCPNSTTIPVPCLPGTYSNSSGNEKESDCQPCLSGQFCDGPGNVVPDGPCSMGFYCPPGQSSAHPMLFVCPINFYCPEGTSIPLPCRGGTYQANKGQGSCDPCPAGFFCQFTNGSSGKLYEPCPAGFFCPAGTTMGTEHPCAMGTFGPRPGLAHESSCVPCSPGMHCASAGLSNPTGPCHPGYYCTGSAISPTPIKHLVEFDNATFTGNDVCPIGHYCPEGSQHPWPCPQGSYSHTVGLVSEAQCQRCPHGHYCNQLGLTDVSQAQPCDPGYVCHTGSTVPRPSDGIQGYVCPRGHRCPAGVIRELVCKAGTYNPSPGAGICLLCPAGTVCSNSSTVEPTACPKGYYCSSRTTFPLPCPEGTYNALNGASSADVCLSCPAGLYCQGMANSEPDGPCTEGYYCQGGASSPIPQSNPKFPMNGPCAAGYYCPAGTKSPIACPKGTFKNTTGGASSEFCAPCYPGYYCANEGLSQPNGLCFAGFYCPGNHNSVNPNAFSCPKGYFCSEGSGSPIPCPAGKYQPNMRSDVCIPCQAGFYCKEAATVNQITCPPHFFCPNGTQNPIPCPSGTFTSGQTTGLKEEKQCLPCPTGKYCSRGRIQGFCAAGYFCLAGSHSPIPHGIFPNDTHERNLCEWGQLCAGQCPAGFYCPEGTETTKACPENTIRLQPGGRQLEECQPCPLGHWCKQGDPFLHRCPAGYFCDDIIRAPFSLPVGPQKCPVHTYSNITGATSQAACQPCPPGYYCNETGLTSYENYLCPLGYWCPGKGSHHFCPGGTIGNRTGASFYKHCQPCPPGYYCPDPRRTGQPNINGVPCRAGYECPAGSITEIPCRPASYCGPRTGNATVCPGGYFCPLGSSTYNTPKQLCVFPYFCPANSSSMLPCDGGYMPINVTGLRDRLEKACLICEAGTYRSGSANELHCSPCPEGFYCPVGSESYILNPCPIGYYCSEMTRLPIPCPPGTYGNSSHAKHNSDCYPCPENTFNHLGGQRACFPCGSTSYSSLGSITCKCQGFNRAFQESDGSCICKTGHVYYDETDQKSSNSNSDMDCYPEVYDRCSVGEVRLASTRRCVFPERHNCTPACGEYGGRLDVELGMCHCNKYISAEELCDRVCMAGILNLSAHASHTGELVLTVKNGATRDHKNWVVPHVLGPDGHITDSLRVLFILFKPNGIFGLILSGKYVVDKFLTESEWPDMFQNPHFKTKRSYLQRPVSAAMNGAIPKIPNPIVCLRPNDLILFKLSVHQSNRSLSHYPVYQKDHLFNTNSDWDFGPFRKLDHFIKETNFNISRFAHVFMEPGKYVFYDNAEPERALIVSVNKFGECDNVPSLFQPSSPIHLVQHGILKQQDLNLAPDWALIIGTLCILALITALFTVSAMVMTPIQSVLNPMQKWKPKWRSLGEPYMPPEYIILKDSLGLYETLRPRIAGEGAEAEEESTLIVGKSLAETELEDFSVRTLYDKLEDQNLHLAAQLNKHKSDVQAFYQHISQQTQELKKILECFNSCKCQNKEGKWTFVEELETMSRVQAEASSTMTRDRFGNCTTINFWERSPVTQRNQSSQHLEELFNKLNVLVHKINSGHITISKEMIARAQRLYMFSDGVTVSAQTNTEQEETNPVEQFAVDSADVSGNVEKLGTTLPPVKEDLSVHDSFTESIFPYDEGLTEILVSSSLLKKLEELKQALVKKHCALKTESCDVNPLDPIPWSNQNLIPADLGSLPPHHFVIYRFGCYIVHLLCSSCSHSPVTLLLADNIRTEVRAPCQNILYKNSFYYDANNRILYIKTTWLNNAGGFIVSILHTMAHIKAGTQINDNHHIFTEEFERAVAAVGTTLFLMCCDTTDNGTDDSKDTKILDSENRNKDKQLPYVQSIFEDLIHIKVPPETKFTEEILKERLKKYTFFTLHSMGQQILEPSGTSRKFPILEGRTAATIHLEMDFEDKDEGVAEYNMQTRIAELEEEIDKTNEAFSLYTTKIAEENQQLEHLEQELRIQANLAKEPGEECKSLLEDFGNLLKNLSQARDVLSMLNLQRHCVINRLTELESELAGFYTALEDRPTRISHLRTEAQP